MGGGGECCGSQGREQLTAQCGEKSLTEEVTFEHGLEGAVMMNGGVQLGGWRVLSCAWTRDHEV